MTPKEKADELVDDYKNLHGHPTEQYLDSEDAIMCALIAVDEIMNELSEMNYGLQYFNRMAHWQEVKQEIENLTTN